MTPDEANFLNSKVAHDLTLIGTQWEARNPRFPDKGGLHVVQFDFRNDSETVLHPALVLEEMVMPPPDQPGRGLPGMPTLFCRVRVGPKGEGEYLLPYDRPASVLLCKCCIRFLHPTDRSWSRVNVHDLLCCDGCEVLRPNSEWSGGLRTMTGEAFPFRALEPTSHAEERIVDVFDFDEDPPFMDSAAQHDIFWTRPSDTLRHDAERAWPDLRAVDWGSAYDEHVESRLPEAHYNHLRMNGLLCPKVATAPMGTLVSTSEWRHDMAALVAWPVWMGAPATAEGFGEEPRSVDCLQPQTRRHARFYKEISFNGTNWPTAFSRELPPIPRDGRKAFTFVLDCSPGAVTTLTQGLSEDPYADTRPEDNGPNARLGQNHEIVTLWLGANTGDQVTVPAPRIRIAGEVSRISAHDLLAGSSARLERKSAQPRDWRIVVSNGGYLRLTKLEPEDVMEGQVQEDLARVEVIRSGLPTKAITHDDCYCFTRLSDLNFRETPPANGRPLQYDRVSMERLSAANLTVEAHDAHLMNRGWQRLSSNGPVQLRVVRCTTTAPTSPELTPRSAPVDSPGLQHPASVDQGSGGVAQHTEES